MSNFFNMIAAAAGNAGAAEEKDPYYQNTVLHLKGDGNQGANNLYNPGPPKYLAFSDNSSNEFPITVNGDAYGSNFSPFDLPEKYWSVDFGNGAESSVMGAINPGTGPLTLEFWLKFDGVVNYGGGSTAFFWTVGSKSPYGSIMHITIGTNETIVFRWGYDIWGGGGPYIEKSTSCPFGEWHHYMWTRNGASAELFVDGVSVGTGTGYNGWSSSTAAMDGTIYFNEPATNFYFPGGFNGQVSNFRLTTNQVLVTGNFTPSTTGLTTTEIGHTGNVAASITGNVEYVLYNTNNFYDTHTSRTLVVNYNAGTQNKTSTLSPFEYDIDQESGSGYFDGSGDFLTVPADASFNNFGTGDFTVECWFNTSATTNQALVGTSVFNSSGWTVELSYSGAGYVSFVPAPYQNRIETSSAVFKFNVWNHIAVTRNSGTITIWLNGSSVKTATYTSSISNSANLNIGQFGEGWDARYYFTGHISNVRVVNGTAIYTSAFTPSTSLLTAVTNTQLITCQYSGSVRNVGFIDSSAYQHPITKYGNITQGTFSPFSKPDGRWSRYFGGSIDNLNITSDITGLGTNIQTWEFFVNTGANFGVWNSYDCYAANGRSAFQINSNGTITFTWTTGTGSQDAVTTTGTVNFNEWNHVALIVDPITNGSSNTTIKIFIRGTGETFTSKNFSTQTGWWSAPRVSGRLTGCFGLAADTGYLSNFRIVKDVAVYSGNFTSPTGPLALSGTDSSSSYTNTTNVNTSFSSSNTVLLTYSGPMIKNKATSGSSTVSSGIDNKISLFSPFPLTTAYDPAINGGSAYFDGSGDYIKTLNNMVFGLNRTFVLETWVYPLSYNPNNGVTLFDFRTTNEMGYLVIKGTGTAGQIVLAVGPSTSTTISTTISIPLNAWTHVVAVSDSNGCSIFLNGVRDANTATQATYPLAPRPCVVGMDFGGSSFSPLTGWMSGTRVIKGGTLPYSSSATTISVPTSPPTNDVLNTVFLANYTNAGIYDNSGFGNLESQFDTQIDTETLKYGTGSIKFDGTGDRIRIPYSPEAYYGSQDFTIEVWVNVPNVSGVKPLITYRSDTNSHYGFSISINNNKVDVAMSNSGSAWTIVSSSTETISANTWTHVAVVRNGSNIYTFINGVRDTLTTTYSGINYTYTVPVLIGISGESGNYVYYYTGYMDDFRITKGIARYTANFDPPTKAFPKIGV